AIIDSDPDYSPGGFDDDRMWAVSITGGDYNQQCPGSELKQVWSEKKGLTPEPTFFGVFWYPLGSDNEFMSTSCVE
ncbi:MAG: hypothetical protein GWN81_00735, partial [Phycisphaerae bacterium]|nr:hypothetical protein [Phycisphaerae bacterium]